VSVQKIFGKFQEQMASSYRCVTLIPGFLSTVRI
jgi:hypothetical protein